MHRFCSKCVVNAISLKKCPECDVEFRESPAFVLDYTFCEIIKKVSFDTSLNSYNFYVADKTKGM